MGIAESEWMPLCNATYKNGIEFKAWCKEKPFEDYYHPFFGKLDLKSGKAFLKNANLRRAGYQVDAHPSDFFLGTELARSGRSPLNLDGAATSQEYAYHFDAGLFAEFLKNKAASLGVIHIIDTIDSVLQHDDGAIDSLNLKSGRKLAADFFIDCSGFAALLIGKTLAVDFVSVADRIINDAAVAMPTEMPKGLIKSQTTSTALSSGWAWKIPLTSRYGNGYVYSSAHITSQQAEDELRLHLGGTDAEARHLKMRLGRRKEPWNKNCVAIGLAQGFVEPLEATAIVFTYQTVLAFIRRFDFASVSEAARMEYNTAVNRSFDTIVDYIHLHYLLNTRDDFDYWVDSRNSSHISDQLNFLLESWDDPEKDFFKALEVTSGQVVFPPTSWYCLLAGKGRFPVADKRPNAPQVTSKMALQFVQQLAQNYSDHRESLTRF